MIVVVFTEGGLRPEVQEAWRQTGHTVHYQLTTVRSDFSYADALRRLWRLEGGDLVICEQDVRPPQDSPQSLLECPAPWCTHPHWVGDHFIDHSLGLVKFSADLRRRYPCLVDLVVCQPDIRYWVRRGWTRLDRACNPAVLNRYGKRAAIIQHAAEFHLATPAGTWFTTHDWMGLDVDLAFKLNELGLEPHVHQPPTLHLHDYTAAPKDGHVPWYLREYAERDWPE